MSNTTAGTAQLRQVRRVFRITGSGVHDGPDWTSVRAGRADPDAEQVEQPGPGQLVARHSMLTRHRCAQAQGSRCTRRVNTSALSAIPGRSQALHCICRLCPIAAASEGGRRRAGQPGFPSAQGRRSCDWARRKPLPFCRSVPGLQAAAAWGHGRSWRSDPWSRMTARGAGEGASRRVGCGLQRHRSRRAALLDL